MTRVQSRRWRAEDARRARVILLLSEGRTWDAICDRVGCSRGFVALWRQRFTEELRAGLYSRHRGRAPRPQTPQPGIVLGRPPSGTPLNHLSPFCWLSSPANPQAGRSM